ncbi:MAG: iron-containing alcohol dehydrogenase, partial [Candidatus Bathyarchaeota archaeon]|nr:iron-containing alcohol dehydrogenase [Candidatus Bathyarchaeota archaeon]
NVGYVDIVSNYLKEAGMDVKVFDEVESEPSIENVMEGTKLVKEYAPDWIIGLGGGSCMDAAKVVWVLYERPDIQLEDISPLVELGLRKKARLVCIPTTSGTGSEASWAAVITNKKEHLKLELASREFYPDLSIVDPKLPVGVPRKVAADTGMDVLIAAVEAYVNQWKNDFSDALAIKSMELFFKYFLRSYENENDQEAREKMHNAATIAGLAFSNSQAGVAHAMGHSFGAAFKIPHGRATAVFFPYSIEFGVKEAGERYAEIAEAIGIEAQSVEVAVKKLVDAIRSLMKKIGEPLTVKEMGIKWEDYSQELDVLVAKAEMSTCNFVNPRVASSEELRKLFTYAFDGRNVDF